MNESSVLCFSSRLFSRCAWDCSLLLKTKEYTTILLETLERKCSGDFIALIAVWPITITRASKQRASERIRGLIISALNTKTADNGPRMCVMNGPSNPKGSKMNETRAKSLQQRGT